MPSKLLHVPGWLSGSELGWVLERYRMKLERTQDITLGGQIDPQAMFNDIVKELNAYHDRNPQGIEHPKSHGGVL